MVDGRNNMDKNEVRQFSNWKRNQQTGKMEAFEVDPEVIELEAEEVDPDSVDEFLRMQLDIIEELRNTSPKRKEAQTKFNQLNRRKPKEDFSWEELEELTNQNEIDL